MTDEKPGEQKKAERDRLREENADNLAALDAGATQLAALKAENEQLVAENVLAQSYLDCGHPVQVQLDDGEKKWCGLCQQERRAAKAEATASRYREALEAIRDFPGQDYPRRTDDGYPEEVEYDEFAYCRMVDMYREAAREALAAQGGEGE